MPPERGAPGLEAWQARFHARMRARDSHVDRGQRLVAEMVAARFNEALRQDFPCVAALLDADHFERAAAAYAALHPSTSPSIRNVGAGFAAFLAARSAPSSRPDLAELARLEWARLEVFDAGDDSPLPRETLATWPVEPSSERLLRTIRAFRSVPTRYAVEDTWLATASGLAAPPCRERPGTLFVWRRDFVVCHRRATAVEAVACKRLAQGAQLAQLCDDLAPEGAMNDPVTTVFRTLEQWLADGFMAEGVTAAATPSSS